MNDPCADLPVASSTTKKRGHDQVDDPYADLPSVSKPQDVPRTEVTEEPLKTKKKTTQVPADNDETPKEPLDACQTITKLKGYMLVDKKFAKASVLFAKLLEEQCTTTPTDERMSLLMQTIQDVMEAKKERIHHVDARNDFAALIRVVDKNRDALLEASEFESDVIDNWVLDAVLHNQLFTDDTFLFAKTAKQIAAHITDRRDNAVEMDNLQDIEALDAVLLPCLRTLMGRHATSWAKTPVEMVLGLCTARRLTFGEAARTQIDEWTSAIHQRKVAPNGKPSAAAEMRKNVVAYNQTQTGIKVGKSNHPLYNKD
ncbi:unnamed protein product [Aphanomyces euteiches]|uniref:Uncharacterized protein n=1 Tax=Aphanomyces euteiches TaxID=100861 RepID=A0A6G0XQ94_9STRA|nr:hypothetical protein Ae201684_002385 [Aphanomyces euteiches]KAH9086927.1 hypothetical protein Ae201684P_000342 [Aphanomyces euteiches]KAH9154208.1 hypothetical protein AeRB84_003649 [Aphanomyces euteiches]